MKTLILELLIVTSFSLNVMALDCGVLILTSGDEEYSPKILKALEDKGYQIVDSVDEATFFFGGGNIFGKSSKKWTAILANMKTNEEFFESSIGLFPDRALLKATKKLPVCKKSQN